MSNEYIEELKIKILSENSQEYIVYEMTTVGIGSNANSTINLGFMKIKDKIIPIVIKTSVIKEGAIRGGINQRINKLKAIENESIVKYYNENINENNKLKLFLKYFNRGDLENYINLGQKKSSDLSERQIIDIFLKAIKFLQNDKNISHRDIKPLNVLMDFKNIVLIEFENCKITISLNDITKTRIGTDHFMAPEVYYLTKEYNYNNKLADIFFAWSNIILYVFPR